MHGIRFMNLNFSRISIRGHWWIREVRDALWAFSIVSKRWFVIEVPCDWDDNYKPLVWKLALKVYFWWLDLTPIYFVVNPVTDQVKKLPRISRPNGNNFEFLNALIVHGTAKMIVYNGNYNVYLLGNCVGSQSYVHVAKYNSREET